MTSGATAGVVGLMSGQNPNVLVGLLGIIKSGNAFVPLDPTYPLERIELMVQDCGIEILVTEKAYSDQARRLAAQSTKLRHVIYIEDLSLECAVAPTDIREEQSLGAARAARDPDQTLYIIYTSGSTGRPKGVPISHRNIIPLLRWSKDYFSFGTHTRVLQNLSHCFDFGVFELLTTVLFGGTLYFLDRQNISGIADYNRLIRDQAINTIHSTPTFFREALLAGGGLECVEIVHLGGEALSSELVDRIFAAVGNDCVVYNGYGPTETSVNCAIYPMRRAEHQRTAHSSIPIGRATANNTLYILDQHADLAPIGVAGELYVGGAGLARGYLNRSELTAERFVPNPFRKDEGGRMKDESDPSFIPHPSSFILYRTGDLARYLADGNIEYLGRLDQQVKLRGFRVELGEIEAALHQHPSVRDAVVVAREDLPGEKRLVAYLVPTNDQRPTTNDQRQGDKESEQSAIAEMPSSILHPPSSILAELRAFLKARLPDYMVPAAFVFLDSLPLTTSGKIDRHSLPAPESSRPAMEHAFVAPRTTAEEVLAEIWAGVLGIDQIGADDNFFEIGGHSLLATQVIARLNEALQIELPLRRMFEKQTLAEFAAAIEEILIEEIDILTDEEARELVGEIPDGHYADV